MVCVHSDLLSVNIYGGESLSMCSDVPLAEQRAVETCGWIGGVGGRVGTVHAKQVRSFFCGGLSVTRVGFERGPSSHFRGCQSAGYSTTSCKNEPAGAFFSLSLSFWRACDLTESREVVGDMVDGWRGGRIRISSCSPSNGGEDTAAVTPRWWQINGWMGRACVRRAQIMCSSSPFRK